MRRVVAARAAAASAALVLLAAAAVAGDGPAPEAVRTARDAVYATGEFDIRDRAGRESLLLRILSRIEEVIGEFRAAYPVLFVVILVAMLLILVAIVAHMIWTVRVARRAEWQEDSADDLESALRRLDPRPFRARALSHAGEGRLDDAVRDLYVALLLVLDRRGAVRYAAHKALLDYRIEASRQPRARAVLDLFDAAYPPGSFGRRPPSRERFDGLVAALDELSARGTG